jgi:methionyl-tRNA formyltransferase
VLFGSGSPASVLALEALTRRASVVAVALPAGPAVSGPRAALRTLRRRRQARPLGAEARRRGIPRLPYRAGEGERLIPELCALRVDLFCVATFPYLLPAALLEAAPAGVLGIHPSPLPRHRGPAPLFWTYYENDADAGVSVFRLDAGTDSGSVVLQETFPLTRGRLGSELYLEIARRGAALLGRAVEEVSAGRAAFLAQDESRATHEPKPRPGTWRIDFETWGCERVWHFVRGVGEGGRILSDGRGRALAHGPARSVVADVPARAPGTLERGTDGWTVHCLDGRVEVASR